MDDTRQEAAVKRMRAQVRRWRGVGLAPRCLGDRACAAHAGAEQETAGISYINPFPPGDIYKLQAYGDAFAEGLLTGSTSSMAGDTRVQVQRRHRALTGLARADFEDELRVEEGPAASPCTSASS